MSTSNIYYMNKFFIYIFTICALISCQKIDEIKFNIDYFEIDYQAQEIILNTNKNIGIIEKNDSFIGVCLGRTDNKRANGCD